MLNNSYPQYQLWKKGCFSMSRRKDKIYNGVGDDLGWNGYPSYHGWTDFTDEIAQVEDARYLSEFATAFPRMRSIDTFAANGALSATVYPNISTQRAQRSLLKTKALNPDLKIMYGITNNIFSVSGYPQYSQFIPSAYPLYEAYVLACADWAQANGIYSFCVGNENLIGAAHYSSNVGMPVALITRTSNVATASFAFPHGLTTGQYITVTGGTDTSFRVADSETVETVQCTVIDQYRISYPSTGTNGSSTGQYRIQWSAREVIRVVKALMVKVATRFTIGPVIYCESQGHTVGWIDLGIPDGNFQFGLNGYGDGTEATTTGRAAWKAEIDACFAKFGNRLVISEYNIVGDTGNWKVKGRDYRDRGFEKPYIQEMLWRLRYMRSLGIPEIYFFGTIEGQIFYNTYKLRSYLNRYIRGFFKPIYYALRGDRKKAFFFGTGKLDPNEPGGNYWY